jgi:hypothetical protein
MIVSTTLTRNLTWTPLNQISYLKGSSMDSFTLGLLRKIDFNDKHSNNIMATLTELADLHNIYLNNLFKYRRIQQWIHTNYMPRDLY